MIKKNLSKVEDDVRKQAYAACLTHYCYKQNYCTNKCLLRKECVKISTDNGYDEGDFKRWPLPILTECMKKTRSFITIYTNGESRTIPE